MLNKKAFSERIKNFINGKVNKPNDEDVSMAYAEKLYDFFMKTIREELLDSQDVKIPRVGFIRIVESEERSARNPKTGESVIIPPRRNARFKISKKFRKDL